MSPEVKYRHIRLPKLEVLEALAEISREPLYLSPFKKAHIRLKRPFEWAPESAVPVPAAIPLFEPAEIRPLRPARVVSAAQLARIQRRLGF